VNSQTTWLPLGSNQVLQRMVLKTNQHLRIFNEIKDLD
jgi:hypothetical protein